MIVIIIIIIYLLLDFPHSRIFGIFGIFHLSFRLSFPSASDGRSHDIFLCCAALSLRVTLRMIDSTKWVDVVCLLDE